MMYLLGKRLWEGAAEQKPGRPQHCTVGVGWKETWVRKKPQVMILWLCWELVLLTPLSFPSLQIVAQVPQAWTGISSWIVSAEPQGSEVPRDPSKQLGLLNLDPTLTHLLPSYWLLSHPGLPPESRSIRPCLQGRAPQPRLKPSHRCWRWDKLGNTNNANAGWIGLCFPDQIPTV